MDWGSIMDPYPTAMHLIKDLEYQEWEQLKDSELVLQISQADMEQTLVVNPDHNKHHYLLYLRVLINSFITQFLETFGMSDHSEWLGTSALFI